MKQLFQEAFLKSTKQNKFEFQKKSNLKNSIRANIAIVNSMAVTVS